jgi:phosphoglycerate dehydrogenase-like enzyme
MTSSLRGARRVVVTWPNFDLGTGSAGASLVAAGLQVVLEPKTGLRTPEEVIAIMDGAQAAIVSTDPFTERVLHALPDLRVLARVGVGTDSIDLKAATSCGVLVTTTPDANYRMVADHVLAMMLALVRRLPENDASIRAGNWDRAGSLTPRDLGTMTVGLLGFGRIGRAVAARLAPFGPRLLASDPQGVPADAGVQGVDLETLARCSDILSVHVPLTEHTRGIVSASFIERLPPGAVLINASRGGIVDEAALAAALERGHLAGAGLDVFEQESPTGSRLLGLPQVILSPHIGGLSHESIADMTRQAAQSVLIALQGREPVGAVNPEAMASWTDPPVHSVAVEGNG